jgi:hypothetical protein
VTTESLPGQTFQAVVREIAQQADRTRGTVMVKLDIVTTALAAATDKAAPSAAEPPPAAGGLKPGMAVHVRFAARNPT